MEADKVMNSYMEEYVEQRKNKQSELLQEFEMMMRENKKKTDKFNINEIIKIFVTNKENVKSPILHLKFPENFTLIRAFIYSLSCGLNGDEVTSEQFLAACNRFGIDNPLPIITKRISLYGNNEDLAKEFQKLVERYKKIEPRLDIDPDAISCPEMKEV